MRAAVIASLLVPTLAFAQAPPDAGSSVYNKVVRSTAWIITRRPTSVATGSGALVDAHRRLVLTNYHVVGGADHVTVVFAVMRNSRPIAERDFYQRRLNDYGMRGKVIVRDQPHDLALIQLDRAPQGIPALKLAQTPVVPGQSVHSIGNPGGSGALWVYTPGRVRQVYRRNWRSDIDGREQRFQAEVVETDSPTNPGDSGGPLVNDAGELVGVTQGGVTNVQSISNFIAASEVRRLLNSAEVARAAGAPAAPDKPDRKEVVASRDDAKLFSASAFDAAKSAAQEYFSKKRRDIVVQTFAQVPDGKTAEVKAMKPEDRQAFYRDWAHKRTKADDIHGILLLATKEPSTIFIHATDDVRITGDEVKRIREAVLVHFKRREFDAGLAEFTRLSKEAMEK